MTDTPLFIGNNAPPSGSTNYASVSSGLVNWNSTETTRRTPMPIAGVFKNLLIKLTTAPGGATTWTFTLFLNGVATALTCGLTGAATTASDITHSVTIAAADLVSIEAKPSGGPAAAGNFYCSLLFTSTTTGDSFVTYSTISASGSGVRTDYSGVQGMALPSETVITKVNQCMPCAGTFDRLYVNTIFNSVTTITYTLFVNGVATALTAPVIASTTGNDLTHSVAVVAGDLVAMQIVGLAGSNPETERYGMRFRPTIDGESLQLNCFSVVGSAGATAYSNVAGSGSTFNATDANMQMLTQACVVKKMYMNVTVAPGAANSVQHTVRKNGANQTLTATISGAAATTANDTTHSDTFAAGDVISLEVICTAGIAAANKNIGLVSYIAPPVTGVSSTRMMMGMGF